MAQFKQGVRSVAGKLSVFANGVMTSIQVSAPGVTGTEWGGGSGVENATWTALHLLADSISCC